tara:strand:+ start:298 stop:504 length:207 start_codon:yes stop_codon:yes gene_type:complete
MLSSDPEADSADFVITKMFSSAMPITETIQRVWRNLLVSENSCIPVRRKHTIQPTVRATLRFLVAASP